MKIEENIRKEKRAKLLNQIRKPLLNTPGNPGSKRTRNAEEVWEASQVDQNELPELPSKPEGGSRDTANCTGGITCVEEQQNGNEAATHAGGHPSAMGEYQTVPELPSQPEGGRGDTATCTGGVICVEEQDGYETATHAGRHSSAMGECLAIENPAMMEGQAIMYDGGSAEITEAEIQIKLTEEEELILTKHPKFTLLKNLKLDDLELHF